MTGSAALDMLRFKHRFMLHIMVLLCLDHIVQCSAINFGVRVTALFQPSRSFDRMSSIFDERRLMFTPAQEVRVRIELSDTYTRLLLLNSTNFRVSIVNAYPLRAESGVRVTCNSVSDNDIWADIQSGAPNTFTFGQSASLAIYATFVVPPFPFRICVKYDIVFKYNSTVPGFDTVNQYSDVGEVFGVKAPRYIVVNSTRKQGTIDSAWAEVFNLQNTVLFVNESVPYVWTSSSTMYEGDYAAIPILQNGYRHPQYVPSQHDLRDGDVAKLVPLGFPCTYEEHRSYCGGHVQPFDGKLTSTRCIFSGAVEGGVARIGTNSYNPLSARTEPPKRILQRADIASGTFLVAYFRLPPRGTYDICYSPRAQRRFSTNSTGSYWYKIGKTGSGCPNSYSDSVKYHAGCRALNRLVVSTNDDVLRWTSDDVSPGSWGTIQIMSLNANVRLKSSPATKWEHSDTPEFVTTIGGDQFRIVEDSRFFVKPLIHGTMFKDSNGNRLKTSSHRVSSSSGVSYVSENRIDVTNAIVTIGASNEKLTIRHVGIADLGSTLESSTHNTFGGCWHSYGDNFGNYENGLNGITSAMGSDTTCCTPSGVPARCHTERCALSDEGGHGVTASGNLGGDPRVQGWNIDDVSTLNVYAYVRFPSKQKRWRVCYRRAGTENWRVLQHVVTGEKVVDPKWIQSSFNGTFYMNDTRAGTWGSMHIRSHIANLNTMPSTFYTAPISTPVGSQFKLVNHFDGCYMGPAVSETMSTDPGLPECEVGRCRGSSTCSDCLGQADDSQMLRTEIVFYMRVPPMKTNGGYYRVCFQFGSSNWHMLRNPFFVSHTYLSSPWTFNPLPAPRIDVFLRDKQAGTFGRFVITRRASSVRYLSVFPNVNDAGFTVGDVFRLVPNRTVRGTQQSSHCDATWGVPSSNPLNAQNFNPALANWDMGVYCTSTTSATSSMCYTETVNPTDYVTPAHYPYQTIDPNANGQIFTTTESAVAFITLPIPTSTTDSWHMCYKQAGMNWIELNHPFGGAPAPLSVSAAPTLAASFHGSEDDSVGFVYAGMYGYIRLVGSSISLDNDLVKLVRSPSDCSAAPGGTSAFGSKYISFVWRGATEQAFGGQRLVNDASPNETQSSLGARGLVASARAYMIFPTERGANTAVVDTAYNLCYMSRSYPTEIDANWHHLGSITVRSLGITYRVLNTPYTSGVLRLRIFSTATPLNTIGGTGDHSKIVSASSPCLGAEFSLSKNRPPDIASVHVGQELSRLTLGLTAENTTIQEAGITDLGPDDRAPTTAAVLEATLPASSTTHYKVCYKPVGYPWMEVSAAPLALHKVAIKTPAIETVGTIVASFSAASSLRAQTPFGSSRFLNQVYSSLFIAGSTTRSYGTNVSLLNVTFSAAPTNMNEVSYKFVLQVTQTQRGYSPINGVNCLGTSVLSGQLLPITSTVGAVVTSLPMLAGRYLLCIKVPGVDTWIQVPSDSSAYSNPLTVVSSSLTFVKNSTDNSFIVTDSFSGMYSGMNLGLGAISKTDMLYVVSETALCGVNNGVSGVVNPTFESTDQQRGAVATVAVSGPPDSPGLYKLCYYRSQMTSTVHAVSSEPFPYVPIGWYQLLYTGVSSPDGSRYFSSTIAHRVKILSCPYTNASYALTPGQTFDVEVAIVDRYGQVLPNENRVIVAEPQASIVMNNFGGTCEAKKSADFSWGTANLNQWTTNGKVTFTFSAQSTCPEGICAIRFSSNGIIGSGGATGEALECRLYLANSRLASLSIVGAPLTCRPGQPCKFRLRALTSDSKTAFTASEGISLISGSFNGLRFEVNGRTLADNTELAIGYFLGGLFDINLGVFADDGSKFLADMNILLRFTVSNGVALTHTLRIERPRLHSAKIIDVYPVDVVYGNQAPSDNFIRPDFVPSWEPLSSTGVWQGGLSPQAAKSELIAAPGRYFIAQQHYTVVLQGMDQFGNSIDFVSLLNSASISIEASFNNVAGNSVLRQSNSEQSDAAFSSVQWTSAKQKVTFRMKNANGCSATSPCAINFKFNGAQLPGGFVGITTPVRSSAIRLVPLCWPATQDTLPAEITLGTGTATCPISAVEKGWTIKLTAVDLLGNTDAYFEGNAIPLLRGGDGARGPNGVEITTVEALKLGKPANLSFSFTAGVAWMHRLTLSKPCDPGGCELEVATDWGTELLFAGPLVTKHSTTKLQCKLSKPLFACQSLDNIPGSSCASVTGHMSYSTTNADTNKNSLIYRDTKVCVTITAVNDEDEPTLYESNWVMYWARTVPFNSGKTLTLTDTGSSPSRVKAMVRSTVEFCFTATGDNRLQFALYFAAQRFQDSGYWATSNGECSLGTFTHWSYKHVANVVVTAVQDPVLTYTPLPASNIVTYAQRVDTDKTDPATKLSFAFHDHYGNVVGSSEIEQTQGTYNLMISNCLQTTSISTCLTSGSSLNSASAMSVFTTSDARETGLVKLVINSAVTHMTASLVQYTFTLQKWCLGCYIEFKIRTDKDVDFKAKNGAGLEYTPKVRAEVNVLLPQQSSGVLAYRVGTSPTTTYWQKWHIPSIIGTASVSESVGSLAIFKDTCFSSDSSTCEPWDLWFTPTACEETGTNASWIAASKMGAPIEAYVVLSTNTSNVISSNFEPQCINGDCSVVANVIGQVDILNSYDISVSMGMQRLACSSKYPCENDASTNPSQRLSALGSTLPEAIAAYMARASTPSPFNTAKFVVQGMDSSPYYTVASDGKKTTRTHPLVNTTMTISAKPRDTTSALAPSSLTSPSGYSFVFRGPRTPQQLVVKDSALEESCIRSTLVPCLSSSFTECSYNGYRRFVALEKLGVSPFFNETIGSGEVVPINVPIPITVQLDDSTAKRVVGARGSIKVEKLAEYRCNDGGILSVVNHTDGHVPMSTGRVTIWVTFSAPCQSCYLRFTLTPDPSQSALYAVIKQTPGAVVAYSKIFRVRDNLAGTGTHLVVDQAIGAKSMLNVRDVISLKLMPAVAFQHMMLFDPGATGVVSVYNAIQSASPTQWYGNGGVLRRMPATMSTTASNAHHDVIVNFNSAAVVEAQFRFSRTCTKGCKITVVYTVNGFANSFQLQNEIGGLTFAVHAIANAQIISGFKPRSVLAAQDFAVSLLYVDKDIVSGDVYGIGDNTMTRAAADLFPEDTTNGNGGEFTSLVIPHKNSGEIHRYKIARSCNRCRIRSTNDSLVVNVRVKATRLRARRTFASTTSTISTYPMGTPLTYDVDAVDELGFVDVWRGGYSGGTTFPCFASLPFECAHSSEQLQAAISSQPSVYATFTEEQSLGIADTMASVELQNGAIVDGEARGVKLTINGPAKNAYPIFSLGVPPNNISSLNNSAGTEALDVSVGNNDVALRLDVSPKPTERISVLESINLRAWAVKYLQAVDRFMAVPTVENDVHVTFGSVCPPIDSVNENVLSVVKNSNALNETRLMLSMKKGFISGSFSFAEISTPFVLCNVTVNMIPVGASSCSRQNASACERTFVLNITALEVTHWSFLQPTTIANDGTPGPWFGSAQRRTFIEIGLQANIRNRVVPLTSCDNPTTANFTEYCTLSVTYSNCSSFTPEFSPANTSNMHFANGSVTLSARWPAAPSTRLDNKYTCGLHFTVKRWVRLSNGTETSSRLMNLAQHDNTTVQVCTPHHVVFVTNASALYHDVVILTGKRYDFNVQVLDNHGRLCKGDTQSDATELSVDVVTAGSIQRSIPYLTVLNTNVLGTKTSLPISNTVRAIAGAFNFNLYFTNSSLALGASGIRIRVKASSFFPAVESTALTPSFDTQIQAKKLRFRPGSELPAYWVVGRPLRTMQGSSIIYVEAVDGLEPSWATETNYLEHSPNIVWRANERGSSIRVFWNVNPLPPGEFPLSFESGVQSARLYRGQMEYAVTYNGADGEYTLSVQPTESQYADILPATSPKITFQSIKGIRLDPKIVSAASCTSECDLPDVNIDTADYEPFRFHNVTALHQFNVSVRVTDAFGVTVRGDNDSYVRVSLVDPLGRNPQLILSAPPTLTHRGPIDVRVVDGVAHFQLGFVGKTSVPVGPILKFECAAKVTVRDAVTGLPTTIDNPCAGVSNTIQTIPFVVPSINVDAAVWDDTTVKASSVIVKVPTRLPSLSLLNVTNFKLEIAARLNPRFGYISTANADAVLKITACEVDREMFITVDLGSTVCGASQRCTSVSSDTCPPAVVQCMCPPSSSTTSTHHNNRRHRTLQSVEVQIELSVELARAVGFAATSVEVITKENTALGEFTTSLLRTDATLSRTFAIDTTNVGSRTADVPATTATPAPPIYTKTPPTAAPPPIITRVPVFDGAMGLKVHISQWMFVIFATVLIYVGLVQ